VKRRLRGIWFSAASGQMFRQNPGAMKNSSGSSGTMNRQKTFSPVAGTATSSATTTNAPATLNTRTTCHTHRGTRLRICM